MNITLEKKIASLKAKRANLLGRAKRETKRLEKEFQLDHKQPIADQIKRWQGKYYAIVGPLLKEVKEIDRAIELLG
ncbi:MAG: hypothetical protein IKB61_04385 [Elusimicrobiaceae bacterium]|nr:hypothetical protein [Elusimicrobiaceae bacterium]